MKSRSTAQPFKRGDAPRISFIGVTPHFHRTLDVPIIRGRDFTEAEGWSRLPVAVDQPRDGRAAVAGLGGCWPPLPPARFRSPQRMVHGDRRGADLRLFGVDPSNSQPPAYALVPYAHQEALSTGVTIRVAGEPTSITAATRAEISASDPNIATYWVRPMEDVRRVSFWQYGLYGWIFGTIGVVGLLLASVGVYGVLSYSVSQRRQEIGVRVALGANRGHVLKLVVGQGLLLAGVGVACGLALASVGTPLARSLLYNVSPFDPFTFIAVSTFLVSVAFLASFIPARRATGWIHWSR